MNSSYTLPFKVGQQAESKSFEKGFRGAWFRCKIHEINRKKGQTKYALEFFDYPDDKIKLTTLYQRPRLGPPKRRKELKPQLMLRPSYPPLYYESNAKPCLDAISEDIVIARDFWKEGDMVDWLYEGGYWCARVTKLSGDDKVQVELPKPPDGEGNSYEAFSKDLRPSLHWSPELGWIVPLPKGKGTSCCARLVRPSKNDQTRTEPSFVDKMDTKSSCGTESSISSNRLPGPFSYSKGAPLPGKGKNDKGPLPGAGRVDINFRSATSISSNICPPLTGSSYPEMASARQNLDATGHGVEAEVTSCPVVTPDVDLHATREENLDEVFGKDSDRETDAVSCSEGLAEFSSEKKEKSLREDPYISQLAPVTLKRTTRSENLAPVVHVDPIELSLMDLEELANKIRWIKGLLRFGPSWPNAMKPSWKFHEAG